MSKKLDGISWVIIGSQTRPTAMPQISDVEEIVKACDKASIPVFLKDNVGHCLQYGYDFNLTHVRDSHGVLVVRQEMPKL